MLKDIWFLIENVGRDSIENIKICSVDILHRVSSGENFKKDLYKFGIWLVEVHGIYIYILFNNELIKPYCLLKKKNVSKLSSDPLNYALNEVCNTQKQTGDPIKGMVH